MVPSRAWWQELVRRLMEEAAEDQRKLDAIVKPDSPAGIVEQPPEPKQTEQ